MEKTYSERLRKSRVISEEKSYLLNDNYTERKPLTDDEVIEQIKNFCNASDLVGVKPINAWNMFCGFIEENGLPYVFQDRFAKLVRRAFPGLRRKRVRLDKNNLIWVYTIGGTAGR